MARRLSTTDSHGSVRLGDVEVPYEIVRSSRARRVRLRVGPRPVVEIIAPEAVRLGNLKDLLRPHREWIVEQFARLAEPRPPVFALQTGTKLPFRGEELLLNVRDGPAGRCTVSRWDQNLLALSPAGDAWLLAAGLEGWYRQQARAVFHDRSDHWARKLGVNFKRLAVRDQRSRWGSCSSLGNLNFNWRLVMAPRAVLDYVVVHELAHLAEPNHSPAFWKLVERFSPAYEQHKEWLKENGERLASYFR